MDKYEITISTGPNGSGFSEFVVNLHGDPESAIPLVLSINNGTASAKLVKVTEGREEIDVYELGQKNRER